MSVEDYLDKKLKSSQGKNADLWRTLQELYTKKFWHPLIDKVKECVTNSDFMEDQDVIEMHEKFIKDFEHRTNALTLTEIIIIMAHHIEDKNEAVKFVESIKNVVKNNGEACVLLLVGIADIKLTIRDKDGRCLLINDVKVLLDDAQLKLSNLNGVTSVHGPFYRCSSIYLRETGNYAAYYREALRYLGCVDINKFSAEEKSFHALCLAIAAILGENVYNFGELLAHPILDCLKGTPHYYLVDLLYAFNSGDLKKFDYLRNHWAKQDDLAKQTPNLEKKIRLMAFVELAFGLLAKGRRLKFEEISKRTGIKKDQVEYLVMKALSLKLIEGSINEIDQTVEITWVQPRVLDKKQILGMSTKFGHWAQEMEKMSQFVQEQAKDILTQG